MAAITVLGAGNWGTTLALLLHTKGHSLKLWEYDLERASHLQEWRENREFLPGHNIPESIEITSDIALGVNGSQVLIFALPSSTVRGVAREIGSSAGTSILLNVSKGLENDTLKRMSEVISEEVPGSRVVSLAGPCIATEVALQIPTTVVVASSDERVCSDVQDMLMTPHFRVYTHDDVTGVELGGALKNIIAIAAGVCDGFGLGANTKGALVTRGLAEMTRLGTAMGASPATFAGLSGLGDLVTTCFSAHSRNRRVGEEIAKGKGLKQVLAEMVMVAEGVNTTRCAMELARLRSVEMPITAEIHGVLFESQDPSRAIENLMIRPAKPEIWS
jgi:glycerol-3-phosphate dehydrogenase (NAD(P)+)